MTRLCYEKYIIKHINNFVRMSINKRLNALAWRRFLIGGFIMNTYSFDDLIQRLKDLNDDQALFFLKKILWRKRNW